MDIIIHHEINNYKCFTFFVFQYLLSFRKIGIFKRLHHDSENQDY